VESITTHQATRKRAHESSSSDANLSRDTLGQVRRNLCKDGQLTLLNVGTLNAGNVPGNILDKAFLCSVIVNLLPQLTWLLKVQLIVNRRKESVNAGCCKVVVQSSTGTDVALLVLQWQDAADVVGSAALVARYGHGSVTLEVGNWNQWGVDGNLLVVDTETVTVSVGVREETALQDWVGRWLNARHKVRGSVGDLLDLCKVVGWVLVEGDLADGAEWVLAVWPNLGEVKDGVLKLLGLLLRHRLNRDSPRREVSLLDLLKELLVVNVWVLTRELDTLLLRVELDTLVGANVDLNVLPLALLVDKLERVASVAVLEGVSSRDSTVSERIMTW